MSCVLYTCICISIYWHKKYATKIAECFSETSWFISWFCFSFLFLRVISRAPGLKLVVQTLLSSLKPIGNIVIICCTFFVIFGILGIQVSLLRKMYAALKLRSYFTATYLCYWCIDHSSTAAQRRTAPQVHFVAVLHCSSRCRDGNLTTATHHNAVEYEWSLKEYKPKSEDMSCFDVAYRQAYKIMAQLISYMWLVLVCNIYYVIWMLQIKTSHL